VMDRYKPRALSMSSASVPISGILPNTTALTQCEATRQESVVDTAQCKWIASKGFVSGNKNYVEVVVGNDRRSFALPGDTGGRCR
jgi:hypothetical protein